MIFPALGRSVIDSPTFFQKITPLGNTTNTAGIAMSRPFMATPYAVETRKPSSRSSG